VNEPKNFYDQTFHKRMAAYRKRPNLRLELATAAVLDHVTPDTVALEVGCGIGLTSQRIARKAPLGFVYGCDLSDSNIDLARQILSTPNSKFFRLDVAATPEQLAAHVKHTLDLVTFIDVIEHIPSRGREPLFAVLASLCAPNASLVFTFPTPEYQEYLKANRPTELQPVDESIQVGDLSTELCPHGFELVSFQYKDVWRTNQYAHAVFARAPSCETLHPKPWQRAERLLPDPIRPSHMRHRLRIAVGAGRDWIRTRRNRE
jgi:SAM-dependent methyltransferase